MKAFLLAAGLGTRLKPYTEHTPKCLIPIKNRPLLDYWVTLLTRHGITDVLINTHHLSEKVVAFCNQVRSNINITLAYEDVLLGSCGTVLKNKEFIQPDETFFIIYADALTTINLGKMLEFHRATKSPFTIALYRTLTPSMCGIVEQDDTGVIRSFIEKPAFPLSNLANTGIYLTDYSFFTNPILMESHSPFDFGFHVLPNLIGKSYGYICEDYFIDIGSHETLQIAENTYPFHREIILTQK